MTFTLFFGSHVGVIGFVNLCKIFYEYLRFRKCKDLKEQCHEDFVVLGQFCAKIITSRL